MSEARLSPLFTWRSAVVSSDLTTSVKATALCLSLHMNERGGSCFPSVKTLARETSLSERGVRYAISALIAGGWLERDLGGGSRSNTYHALTPAHDAPLQHVPGAQVAATPAPVAPTPALVAAEDVIEDDSEDVKIIYDHWRRVRGKSRATYAKVSRARARCIRARLRDGFTVADLCRALDAVDLDPWAERSQHDDITKLFRNREAVDRWLDFADNPPAPKANGNGVDAATILNEARELHVLEGGR